MTPLSPQRAAILAYVQACAEQDGRPPSLAEIAERFGFASRNAARKHVQALVEAGLLAQVPQQARSLRPAQAGHRSELLQLPVLGRVAAGAPIGADIGLDQQLRLDRAVFALRPDYLLRVQGDSMIDDGILDGDLVGVRRAADARNGQIVVARLDGELTIKRYRDDGEGIALLPRNPAYAPIVVGPGQDFAIEGHYCGLIRPG
ncbi:MAG: transcriptional repressor LexA [Xanthomonas sp.]